MTEQIIREQCYHRQIDIDCPSIPKIALKFDVTEEQVLDWIKSGKGSCYGYMLSVRYEAWWYRLRSEMTGGVS